MYHDEVIGDRGDDAAYLELIVGNGTYSLDKEKKCRNDHEYGFVRAYCAGGSEGL